jgi:hypothetical protein
MRGSRRTAVEVEGKRGVACKKRVHAASRTADTVDVSERGWAKRAERTRARNEEGRKHDDDERAERRIKVVRGGELQKKNRDGNRRTESDT